ncbi:MAG: OadG family protein [Clostridia bacterium]|nr:OadG family protein [Clostridia bacterium]
MRINPSFFILQNAIADSMTDMPIGERMALGLRVTVLGMGTCFAVLAILWGILSLFKLIFAREKKPSGDALPAADTKALPAAEPEPEPEAQDDGELIAVITAAAYAYLSQEEQEPQTRFRVVSFSKTGKEKIRNRQRN